MIQIIFINYESHWAILECMYDPPDRSPFVVKLEKGIWPPVREQKNKLRTMWKKACYDNGNEIFTVMVPFETKCVDDPLKNDVTTAPENEIGESKPRELLPMIHNRKMDEC